MITLCQLLVDLICNYVIEKKMPHMYKFNKTHLHGVCCRISRCLTSHKLKAITKPTKKTSQQGPASAIPVYQISLK